MDLEEKKLYHHNYNKNYYLKKKLAKQVEPKSYFRKITSLTDRRNNIEKLLKENNDKAEKFRQQLNSPSI